MIACKPIPVDIGPLAPSGTMAFATSNSAIDVSWSDNSNNEYGFEIQRKTGSTGTYAQIATVGSNDTTYTDSGLNPATTYYYRVRAYNNAGASGWSTEGYATTFFITASYPLDATWESNDKYDQLSQVTATSMQSYEDGSIEPEQRRLSPVPAYRESDAIVIKYRPYVIKTQAVEDRIKAYGREVVVRDAPHFAISRILPNLRAGKTLEQVVDYYNNLPEVQYAEIDELRYALFTPNDEYYQYQWNFTQLNMPLVWDSVTGSESIVVAVIDTGVAYSLDDFSATAFVQGIDIANSDSDPHDDNGHGTHVAGTIAQSTGNTTGTAGMAYNVSIMAVKVLGQDGSGYSSDTAAGITWAVDNGADVINLSLGGASPTQTGLDAVAYAYDNGVAVVAASGNDNSSVGYPAAYDEYVLAVGATRYDKQRAPYSNYGPELDVVAPGGDMNVDQNADGYGDGILQQTIAGYDPADGSTDDTPGYYFFQGTSMATPHVSALASLILTKNESISPIDLYATIISHAEDLGLIGRDDEYGYGLINPLTVLGANPWLVSDTVTGVLNSGDNISDEWNIGAGGGTIEVAVTFIHSEGNIQLYLYDPNGSIVAASETSTDNESISYDVGGISGPYRIEIRLDGL